MTNEFECLRFQVSQKMWFTEGPEDLSAEKSSIPCKSEKFPPFNFQLIFFSCSLQVTRQSGSAVLSACPVDGGDQSAAASTSSCSFTWGSPSILHLCGDIWTLLLWTSFITVTEGVIIACSNDCFSQQCIWQSVSVICFENEVWILKSKINLCSHAYSQIMRALLWDHP